ncbi:MAG: FHA domain-containing protein [Acidimicrobiales bacterium]
MMVAAEGFCNNCGHRNALGANFCPSCGAILESLTPDNTTITFHPVTPGDPIEGDVPVVVEGLPADSAMLVVQRGSKAGSRFALENDVVTAGRHPDSDIFLDDITVSRRHAELRRVTDGTWLACDSGSLNGTYLNRKRIDTAILTSGDELQIGKFKLVFLLGGEDA